MTKEARLCNGGKTLSSINGVVKTGQLHAKKKKIERKKEIRMLFNTMHKNKLKMD